MKVCSNPIGLFADQLDLSILSWSAIFFLSGFQQKRLKKITKFYKEEFLTAN